MAELTKEELDAIIAENKAIIASIRDPKKKAADKAIRDKAVAEGRALTLQELSQLSYRTGDEGRQVTLQEIGAGPQGTVYNPLPTGAAAEKKPNNQEALRFAIYQEYLRQWNYGTRDYTTKQLSRQGVEPMTFEEFIPAFEIGIGADQGRIGQLSSFSKGQGELAVRTGGRQVPGMDLLLDPRFGATVDSVIANYNEQNPDNPINIASGFSGGTDGPYTTMGGTGVGTPFGSSTGIGTGGSTGKTAFDVFKNTLSLFFGPTEMNKSWVNQLYKTVSGFTKSGSTPEEAFNMAVLESRNNPGMADFTKRFKGIFALQDMKQQGKAVTVPTVAEYFATESKMGDLLKSSNLGDLANEDFLGDVLGKGVSATEFGNRITAIFDRIDTAPDVTKKTIGRFFPTLDRIQLAKALALGEKGAKQLEQELAGYEVLGAAEQQGLGVSATLPSGITNEQAQQIAKSGGTYGSTLGQFGQIAAARETEQKLAEISGVQSLGVTGLTSAVISKSASELKKLEDLTRQEEARFSGKSGTIGSKSFASQSRANRKI